MKKLSMALAILALATPSLAHAQDQIISIPSFSQKTNAKENWEKNIVACYLNVKTTKKSLLDNMSTLLHNSSTMKSPEKAEEHILALAYYYIAKHTSNLRHETEYNILQMYRTRSDITRQEISTISTKNLNNLKKDLYETFKDIFNKKTINIIVTSVDELTNYTKSIEEEYNLQKKIDLETKNFVSLKEEMFRKRREHIGNYHLQDALKQKSYLEAIQMIQTYQWMSPADQIETVKKIEEQREEYTANCYVTTLLTSPLPKDEAKTYLETALSSEPNILFTALNKWNQLVK